MAFPLAVTQWTGREHKEMQKVFVGLLVGAVQPGVIKAVRAALDFIYYAQFTSHTTETLAAMEAALYEFHDNKDIFVRLGQRDHFNIPKLHSLLHYVTSIMSRGSADGFNTESPERLHIDYAKDAYRTTNKRDYVEQMTTWLKRQEAVDQFSAYLNWLTNIDVDSGEEMDAGKNEEDDDETLIEDTPQQEKVPITQPFILAAEPGPFPSTRVDRITTDFRCTYFLEALVLYTRGHSASNSASNTILVPEPTIHDHFNVYKHLSIPVISIPAVHNASARTFDRIRATSSMPGKPGRGPAPAHFDTVLVRVENEVNDHTQGTYLKGVSFDTTAF
jgi:hypothetical protein